MERLVSWSLDNRPVVLFLALLWLLVGIYNLQQLPIDAVPDVTNIQVTVNTEAPGLSPPEVESLVTVPVEGVLLGLPDIEQVRSLSKYGLSQVTVVFREGTDLYFARQLVSERLTGLGEDLPGQVSPPSMGPIATGLSEIYQYELIGDERWDPIALRTLQDWFVKRQLLAVDGVTEVNSFGGLEKEYQVVLNPQALQSYGLSYSQVFEALERNNRNVGGGFLESRGDQLLVRGLAMSHNKKELEQIVIADHEGYPLLVSDIATVRIGGALRQGAVTRDGRGEAVTGIVMMLAGENSRTVARRVDERVRELQGDLPDGVRLETFYDRTELVNRTLDTVRTNLLEGALLVVAVLFLFLGNFRAALVVALVIPMSFLAAAFLMVKTGVSGNLMSLGALDFGLIVDGAVVMSEHAMTALAVLQGQLHIRERVRKSCCEVARPLFFGLVIIIAVYLPLLALTGLEGKMFRPMALTVVYALAGSLILSFTLVPVLLSFVLKAEEHKEPPLVRLLKQPYAKIIGWALNSPRLVVVLAMVPLVAALFVGSRLGAVFLPELDEGAIAIQAIRIPSVSLTNSTNSASLIEKAVGSFPEVRSVISKTGRPDLATDPMGVEISDIIVTLHPESEWSVSSKEELVEKIRHRLESIPGMNFSFSQPIELRVEELISGSRSDVALQIYGEDLNELARLGEAVTQKLNGLEGARDVALEQINGVPYLNLEVDRTATARYGLPAGEILDLIDLGLGRRALSSVIEGERIFPVVATLPDSYLQSPESLRALRLRTESGGFVPLSAVVEFKMTEGVAQVNRVNGQRRATVSMNYSGDDLIGFVNRARELTSGVLPNGYVTRWGGEFENFQRATERLAVLVPLVMGMILFLLWLDLQNMKQAFVIYLNVPFAAVGGVFALAMRGFPFSISAAVGFLTLFGVAVLNGLVLLSAVNLEGDGPADWHQVLETAAISRMRPVLMTALVASLGFLPMALSTGAGAEVQKPLATVVIGGLITSTCLTLVVLPVVLKLFCAPKSAQS
jgi:cobalt-zinc-cadmium resistance protein CzcA